MSLVVAASGPKAMWYLTRGTGVVALLLLTAAVVGVPVMFALSFSTATGDAGTGTANIWTGLVLLIAAVMIVYRVLTFGTVTLQSIFGAFSAYLVIGPL